MNRRGTPAGSVHLLHASEGNAGPARPCSRGANRRQARTDCRTEYRPASKGRAHRTTFGQHAPQAVGIELTLETISERHLMFQEPAETLLSKGAMSQSEASGRA